MQGNEGKVRYPVWFALFLMAYYVTNSVYQGYLSVYYSKTLNFTDSQVGAIFAGVAVVSVLTQPFWGAMGDRLRSRNALIRMLCLISAALILLVLPFKNYGVIMAITCLFAAFYMSIQPMGDSIILEALQKKDQPFGPIRLMGGMSFAVASLLFGRIVDRAGREVWAVYFVAGLLIATCLSTYALPHTSGRQGAGGEKMSMARLFKMKDLMILMAFLLPLQLTMGYFYTFFSIHFKSLEGGTSSLLGICYFISATCEIPYLIFSDRLFKKMGVGRLVSISALALTARWLILAISSDYRLAMFGQVFHGWGFIVMTVAASKYINLTVPPELKASGQMLLAVVSFGLARFIGNLGGGVLSDILGIQNVFYICAAITFLSFICFAPYYMRRKPLNGED